MRKAEVMLKEKVQLLDETNKLIEKLEKEYEYADLEKEKIQNNFDLTNL